MSEKSKISAADIHNALAVKLEQLKTKFMVTDADILGAIELLRIQSKIHLSDFIREEMEKQRKAASSDEEPA